ncbi:DUF6221 family protein [Streptomyces sp. NPDC059460]|uniref:DUF6221 family protein n=1 Tax=Streptomyces sp. NPDC059460 TaxID=3346840 RepID=UPI0036A7C6DA
MASAPLSCRLSCQAAATVAGDPETGSDLQVRDPSGSGDRGQIGGRLLRDVEAKCRVLARHMLSPSIDDPELPWDNRNDCQYDGEDWPCPDLLDLALPYTDHPDHREQWRTHRMRTR